jgi:NAD(P)-dependent dehydrogenase (short-subunit alcohol dehydrogenase family)
VPEVADSSTPAVLAALIKGGVAAATRSLAIQYTAYGLRVNAVSSGIIQTPVHPAGGYEHLGGRLPPLGLGRAGQRRRGRRVVLGVLVLHHRRDPAHRRRQIAGH